MADQPTSKPKTLWRVLFAVSLALNLAVIGLVGGALMRDKVGGRSPQGIEFGLGPLGQALDKDDRRAIGRAIRAEVDFTRDGRSAPRRALENVQAALRQDPFDPDALAAILDQTVDRAAQVQSAAQAAFVAHVATMSAEDRNALADRLEEGLKRRPRPNR